MHSDPCTIHCPLLHQVSAHFTVQVHAEQAHTFGTNPRCCCSTFGRFYFLICFFSPWKSPKIFSPSDVTVKRVKILLYTQVSREKKGKLMQREDAVLPEKGPLTLTEIKNCQQVQLKTGSLYSGKHDTSLHFLKCVHPQISHHSLSQALFISCYHSCQHLQEQPAETGSYS